MDFGRYLTSGTSSRYPDQLSSCSGLTLCTSRSGGSGTTSYSPHPLGHLDKTSLRSSSAYHDSSPDSLAYATAFSSLCAVHDAALEVPSILVEDLTCLDTRPSGNTLGYWPASHSAPDLGHIDENSCNALGFLTGSSLRAPLGSWSDDNTLAADSLPCTKSKKSTSPQRDTKRDSLEKPWLDLDDDDNEDSLLQTSGLVDLDFSPGFCLSSLSFIGTIGRGGYGKVLLAERAPDAGITSGHGSQVAVKVLTKSQMNLDDIQELKTEVRILRDIACGPDATPNGRGLEFQQKLQNVFQTREHVFLVMDRHCAPLSHPHFRRCLHLRGHPTPTLAPPLLLSPLPQSFSLPVAFPSCPSIFSPYDEALQSLRLLSAELILGLLFLHERGIVHQDIKPANILVSHTGHAVITDFGSSRFMPELPEMNASRGYHTSHMNDAAFRCEPQGALKRYASIILGADDQVSFTRRYAAPELLGVHAHAGRGLDANGHGPSILVYDERVDFYSLGIMLRELALGESADGSDAKRQDAWERASDGHRVRADGVQLDPDFEDFTNELSAHHPDERLHGPAAKDHPFFEPISGSWDDVAALQFPPFPEVAWQEPDDDTRLDLRAYSGPADSQDSLASSEEHWRDEHLADIPFDPSARVPAGTLQCAPDNSPDLDALRPPLLLPAAISAAPSMVSTLQSPPNTPIVHSESLAPSSLPFPSSEHYPHTLRRRHGMSDLRKAYNSTPVLAPRAVYPHIYQARPTSSARPASARPKAVVPGASALSFEHQITIAMLATMGPRAPHVPTSLGASNEADAKRGGAGGARVKAFFRRMQGKRLA